VREKLSRHQLKKIKITNMLITIMVFFMICNIVRFLNMILLLSNSTVYAEQFGVPNLLITVNCAINYLIYCAFGKSFRQSFTNLITSCCGKNSVKAIGSRKSQDWPVIGSGKQKSPPFVVKLPESPKTSFSSLSSSSSDGSIRPNLAKCN
jgi:hypothetical protein